MDPVQILGSLAAILLLAFIAMRMFPVKAPLDDGKVTRNLQRYEPDAKISEIYLTEDGKAALIQLQAPANALGLTVQLGDRVVCRVITGQDIKRADISHGKLVIHFDDYTQPAIKLAYGIEVLPKVQDLVNTVATSGPTKDMHHAA
ncbi:hypothetical protein [Kordiimonas sp.]|uniref:hypothetical protein n=1 Tax=Kordiimonas sp. TaxID=1970157 RepID=UPI003A8EB057